MSIYSSKRKTRKHLRSQPGHLRLSAYEESSALIVNIFEARGLMRRDTAVLDVYIKLYLLPDPQKSTKRKTKVLKDQDPVFNQKFTFLLSATDAEKQLLISAWTPHLTSRNVMIGCMSFPMTKLVGPNKGLNGWFQLLDEEKGLTEHQQVPVSISQPDRLSHLAAQTPGTSEIAVTVSCGEKRYGFDVRGHSPVYVSSVEHGEAAQQADVRVGDVVANVDDTDVRRANAELVQNLIAKGGCNLQLILLRESRTGSLRRPTPPPSSSFIRETNTLPRSHRPQSQTPTHSHIYIPTQPPSSHLSPSVSYGALSQDNLPLQSSAARTSHHYSSLSHLPRERRLSASPARYGSIDVLSQPTDLSSFDYNPQDQFVHDAHHMRHSVHSYTQQPSVSSHMHSVYEEREDGTAEERVWSQDWQAVPGNRERQERKRERGRRRRSSGEELTQPLYPSHHPPHPSMITFSQPGEPEIKTTRSLSQINHTHSDHAHQYYQHLNRKWKDRQSSSMSQRGGMGSIGRVEKDAMTGESRQCSGPGTSFSPNHPSHHHSSYHHHGNVELIGHQPLVASHSHSYNMTSQYGNGMVMQGKVPHSRIGMGPADGSCRGGREMEDVPIDWESLSPTERKRQKVLQNLMEAESTFCSVLQNGIETYLEPLRSVVSESIHTTLFCNLKELCQISTKVESQLKERRLPYEEGDTKEATPYFITHVADIYHSELPELLSLLKGYLDNLHSAKRELSVAFTNEEFTHLVQKCVLEGKNRSIYAFIEAGKDYVSRLFKALLGAYYYTSASHIDQSYLSTALRQLARICPDEDSVKRWEGEQKVMHKLDMCISFAPKIPKIPIIVPGRVLVKEGEALLIEKKGKTKVWILLFSDIVLLTQRRRGTVMMCLEPAIPLNHLRVADFNCTEDTEFQITNTEGSLIRLLRVPTVAEKSAWMASLKERATGSFQRKHRERQSRVSNLQNPVSLSPSPPSDPMEDSGNKYLRSPEGASRAATGVQPLSQSYPSSDMMSQSWRESGTMERGGRVRRWSQQFVQPDLDQRPAAAKVPGWKRSSSKWRSFNL